MGLISHSMILFGTQPKIVRASLMFNKASGLYWNATGERLYDDSYHIQVYAPFLSTKEESVRIRDQHGTNLGTMTIEVQQFYIMPVDSKHASNLQECVSQLATMQKEKQEEGFTSETHLLNPRFSLPNLKLTAWRHNIEIPGLG